jgi:glutathione S-transferase
MALTLYDNPASPFARKVNVVIAECGLEAEVTRIRAGGNAVDPGTMPLTVNPLGKIPTLTRDSGPALYDSRVICRYLDDLGMGRLYPKGEPLWEALTLEATGDGIMDAAVLVTYETRTRPEERRHAPWVEGQWAKVVRALDTLESRWMAHLAGPFDIGQASVACALGYLDLRHAARGWRDDHPQLAAWFARISERPSLKATLPSG